MPKGQPFSSGSFGQLRYISHFDASSLLVSWTLDRTKTAKRDPRLVGEFTAHFRTYGDRDVDSGYLGFDQWPFWLQLQVWKLLPAGSSIICWPEGRAIAIRCYNPRPGLVGEGRGLSVRCFLWCQGNAPLRHLVLGMTGWGPCSTTVSTAPWANSR